MEFFKINRIINGEGVEIKLTEAEMWSIWDFCSIYGNMQNIQSKIEKHIPEDDLRKAAEEMRDYMVLNDVGYETAIDHVCEEYGFYD